MIKIIWSLVVSVSVLPAFSQFTKATLQASGLTCAMCSNAVNKALQKVPFVETIKSDIKNSAFEMKFKPAEAVEIDALRTAVEDAGFSVGSLKLTGSFSDLKLEKDLHVKIGSGQFHFLNTQGQVLNGEQTVTLVDKNFVTEKQFKKYSSGTKMGCVQTGKADACCIKEGGTAGERIFHVIM